MYYDVIMTGFGGRGIQTISLFVALAAMKKGLEVTYLPSYGVEKRGGRTDVYVIVSDEEIGAPITNAPSALIALDLIGLEFYKKTLREGSLLIANTSLIPEDKITAPKGVMVAGVRFNEEAVAMGNPRLANMLTLGCFVERTHFLDYNDCEAVAGEVIPDRLRETIPDNLKAIRRGIEIARGLG